jgi:hypothetical protein
MIEKLNVPILIGSAVKENDSNLNMRASAPKKTWAI